MESSHQQISQKEYLKKYLSKDKGDKKKKKKVKISSSSHIKRSIIIDDDLGLPGVASVDDEEFNLEYLGDEAPQIAGIVDERPPEVRAKESYGDQSKWKPVENLDENTFIKNLVGKLGPPTVTSNDSALNSDSKIKQNKDIESEKSRGYSESRRKQDHGENDFKRVGGSNHKNTNKNTESDSDSDLSPPRSSDKRGKSLQKNKNKCKYDYSRNEDRRSHNKSFNASDSDLSPARNADRGCQNNEIARKEKNTYVSDSDSDLSPPRKSGGKYSKDCSNRNRKSTKDSGFELPPRKSYSSQKKENLPKHRQCQESSDSDMSPPRRNGRNHSNREESFGKNMRQYNCNGSDLSSKRWKDLNSYPKDSSSKNRKRHQETSGTEASSSHRSVSKHKSDSDLSPPRKKSEKYHRNNAEKLRKGDSDSDLSPPRKKSEKYHKNSGEKLRKGDSDSDLSPPRMKSEKYHKNRVEKLRKGDSDSDLSPPRKPNKDKKIRKDHESKLKLDKTLEGKKAGLQSAKNLKDELRKLRENEDAAFAQMQASVSGKNASAVMRDRKTGKIRNLEKEKQELVEKSVKTIEREKKYAKWGKGLKQIEEAEERLADAIHEMNKPLARYAGDDDLEKMLKAREREGDPMLDYIRSRQAESISLDNIGKPKYQGHFMPNRFGIRPGHRWDGVDRSNGYEKQWFEKQNARKAIQEEAYKWSTSDM